MSKQLIITIDGEMVPVQLERKRMKTVRIRINASGEIHLSAPADVPEKWLKNFLKERHAWIVEKYAEQKSRYVPPETEGGALREGDALLILGRRYAVRMETGQRKQITLSEDTISIVAPEAQSPEQAYLQFDAWQRKEARVCFDQFISRYMPLFAERGVLPPKVTIRAMKTLWGSCAPKKGKITLNLHLFKGPLPSIEYVVLHELTHLIHPSHDRAFYGFIEAIMPDWKARKKALEEMVALR